MITAILKKIFGSKAERDLKRMQPLVARVNELEEEYQKLPEEKLIAKTDEFKQRLKDHIEMGRAVVNRKIKHCLK